jgi:hypothetical protein
MSLQKNRLNKQVEKTEELFKFLLKKKKQNIQNSLVRPLYQEALKSLFLVAVLLLDTLLPLEAYRSLIFPLNIITAIILLGVFLYLEIRVYNAIWGKHGRWALENYKKTSDTTTDKKTEVD